MLLLDVSRTYEFYLFGMLRPCSARCSLAVLGHVFDYAKNLFG